MENFYRIRPVKDGETGPVIFSFGNRKRSLNERKSLLLKNAKENSGKGEVWTSKGRVITEVNNEEVVVINENDPSTFVRVIQLTMTLVIYM